MPGLRLEEPETSRPRGWPQAPASLCLAAQNSQGLWEGMGGLAVALRELTARNPALLSTAWLTCLVLEKPPLRTPREAARLAGQPGGPLLSWFSSDSITCCVALQEFPRHTELLLLGGEGEGCLEEFVQITQRG